MWGKNDEELIKRDVFGCKFKCNNCSFEWTSSFGKGTEINQKEDEVIASLGKKQDSIKCGNCDSDRVTIISRFPIREEQRVVVPQMIQSVPEMQLQKAQQQYEEAMKTLQQFQTKAPEKIDRRRKA